MRIDEHSDGQAGLGDRIDASFGTGPGVVPVEALVARGRRALLRRRIASGAGALAAVVVVVGGTTLVLGDRGPDTLVAGNPTTSVSPDPTAAPADRTLTRPEVKQALRVPMAEYDDAGSLVLAQGVTVLKRIDGAITVTAPRTSVGLELAYDGATFWAAAYWSPDSSSGSALTWSGNEEGTFEDWLATVKGLADETGSWDGTPMQGVADLDLVRFVGDTEQLAAVGGAHVSETVEHVSVGDSFAGPDDQTAVAEVYDADEQIWYVLARRTQGEPAQYIAVPQEQGGASLYDFLARARVQYTDGEGLL